MLASERYNKDTPCKWQLNSFVLFAYLKSLSFFPCNWGGAHPSEMY